MPAKRSRAASRCKPALSNITNKMTKAELKEHKIRLELISEDFKKNAAVCLEQVKEEQKQLEKRLEELHVSYRLQLQPLQNITVTQLQQKDSKGGKKTAGKKARTEDESSNAIDGEDSAPPVDGSAKGTNQEINDTKENHEDCADDKNASNVTESDADESTDTIRSKQSEPKDPSSSSSKSKDPRMSDVSALLAETSDACSKAARPRRKAAANAPNSVTRSTRARKLNTSSDTSTMPAPATTRPIRNKKMVDTAAFVTPAGQRVVPNAGTRVLVTPKFDPRVPLPVGTVRRRPLPNEVPMSITGSPLRVTPPKPQLKEIMTTFLDTLQKETELDSDVLEQYHNVLEKFIDRKVSDS